MEQKPWSQRMEVHLISARDTEATAKSKLQHHLARPGLPYKNDSQVAFSRTSSFQVLEENASEIPQQHSFC